MNWPDDKSTRLREGLDSFTEVFAATKQVSRRAIGRHRRTVDLPVDVPSHADDVRFGCTEDRIVAGNRMDPIHHHSNAVAPIPVHADAQVIVLTSLEIVEIQMGPTGFEFPSARLPGP